jgi:CRP/FNR family transcriptional regulator, cyclic AMP receptor protein
MSKQILLETLGRLRFLQGVAPQHLECLAGIARMEEYDEGETLFAAGEPVDDVYLVIYGEIALEVASSGVNPQLLLSVGAGENFGWSALMHRTHRVATAKATAPTQVFRIDGKRLLALCEEYPRFGYQIMRATAAGLANRLSALQRKYFDVYRLQATEFLCGDVEFGVD